jgi:tetratricopeptide (TPR) repeat protein
LVKQAYQESYFMTALIANRYDLREQLGAGGMGTVFRAQDRLTGGWVALKRVTLPAARAESMTPRDTQNLRVALSNEFRVLASLRHPHIIGVKDYGFDAERQPFYTMDLLEGGRTIAAAGADQPVEQKIRLLIEALQALAYLHRRGLLHRDLKPSNVLVTRERQVKVLDFGLAAVAADLRHDGENQGGTLAYMSPELLVGGLPTPTSDLYAMGIIASELLQGRLPYAKTNPAALIEAKLNELPDVLSIGGRFGPIVGRLLARDPYDRYPSAEAVIAALSEALDQPIPAESAAVRESFLQASQFVGRREEFGRLSAALRALVMSDKRTTTTERVDRLWLVGGESGVGKSRLVDELRIQAMVQGALVLHGQGLAEGGLPYELWREVVRRLLLVVDVSDLEAGILREVVPDVDVLLGRDIPTAPPMDGKPGQTRLAHTIAGLFRRPEQAILLIMEDLHWASESLEVLKQLTLISGELRFMAVGTYRNDERADLPKELPKMQVLTLKRLSVDEIAMLSTAMIGEAGGRAEIVDFLNRETEGNAFFMVEVLRALAEESGSLSDIGRATLPERIIAGGVQHIIRRRLGRVPEADRALLKRAAIAGRQIDPLMLQRLADPLGTPLEEWLTACANVAVLEAKDGQWRFAHDKLREAMLRDLPADEKAELHREVAEAMQAVYPGDEARAAVLTDHWFAAGEVRRGAESAVVAAQVALSAAARRDVLAICERALASLPDDMPAIRVTLLRLRGSAHDDMGDSDQAQVAYEESLALAQMLGDQAGMADALRRLGYMLASRRSEFGKAETLLRQALAIDEAANNRKGIVQSLRNLAWIPYLQSDYANARTQYEKALALGREIGDKRGVANTLGSLAVVSASLSDYPAARQYFEEALQMQRELGNQAGISIQTGNLGAFLSSIGEYAQSRAYLEQSLAMDRALGSRGNEAISLINLGMVTLHQAEYVPSLEYYESGLAIARELGNPRHTGVALAGLGAVKVKMGDWQGAAECFEQAVVLFRQVNDRQNLATRLNGLVELHLLFGEFGKADALLAESFPISQEIGDQRGLAMTLTTRAWLAFAKGDMPAAWADALEALRIRRAIEDRETLDENLQILGLMALWEGQHNAAHAYLDEAVIVSRGTGAVDILADGLCYLSFYHLQRGEVEAARAHLREALQVMEGLLSRPPMTLLRVLLGYAWMVASEGQYQRSAELVGMIEAHPLGNVTTLRRWMLPLRVTLRLALPSEDFDAALDRGQEFDFDLELDLLTIG